MPSGYTADLYEGKPITFEKFVLTCARAFMYSMRDLPLDASIPDPVEKVDSHHLDGIKDAKRDIAKYNKMTVAEAAEKLKKQSEQSAREREKWIKNAKAIRDRYDDMMLKVNKWKSPTELESLKEFMVKQLTESIKFDCAILDRNEKEDKTTPKQYLKMLRDMAKRELEYHTESYNKEVDVAKKNAEWVRVLKTSVKGMS